MVPQVFFRGVDASVPGDPDEDIHLKSLGTEEAIEDIGFSVGDIDEMERRVFSLELSGGVQTVEPFLTFLFGDGPVFTGMFFPKRF